MKHRISSCNGKICLPMGPTGYYCLESWALISNSLACCLFSLCLCSCLPSVRGQNLRSIHGTNLRLPPTGDNYYLGFTSFLPWAHPPGPTGPYSVLTQTRVGNKRKFLLNTWLSPMEFFWVSLRTQQPWSFRTCPAILTPIHRKNAMLCLKPMENYGTHESQQTLHTIDFNVNGLQLTVSES